VAENSDAVTAVAAELYRAALERTPIDSAPASGLSLDDAYRAQRLLVEHSIAADDSVAGTKLGFTSKAKMQQMGVHSPILGLLTEGGRVDDGGSVSLSRYIHPRIEPEVAFLLDEDLDLALPAAEQVSRIGAVAPAMEIIDSRFTGFSFTLSSVVADNTSAAGFVVGPWTRFRPGVTLRNLAVRLSVADQTAGIGSTAAILGDPLRALPVLLDVARRHGHPLRAGSIVLAGAATAAAPLKPGFAEASVAGLGRVALTVTGDEA